MFWKLFVNFVFWLQAEDCLADKMKFEEELLRGKEKIAQLRETRDTLRTTNESMNSEMKKTTEKLEAEVPDNLLEIIAKELSLITYTMYNTIRKSHDNITNTSQTIPFQKLEVLKCKLFLCRYQSFTANTWHKDESWGKQRSCPNQRTTCGVWWRGWRLRTRR